MIYYNFFLVESSVAFGMVLASIILSVLHWRNIVGIVTRALFEMILKDVLIMHVVCTFIYLIMK